MKVLLMGCDIHTFVEYKVPQYKAKADNSAYEKVGMAWISGDFWKVKPRQYMDEPVTEPVGMEIVELYGERDYSMYALLADVRNYGDTEPLSQPRGIPADSCEQIKKQVEELGGDGHSHSYFTLTELLEAQERLPSVKEAGMVDPVTAKKLDEEGTLPTTWCQWTSLKGWVRREWESPSPLYQIIALLEQRARELFHYGYGDVTEEEKQNIRMVFFFDN